MPGVELHCTAESMLVILNLVKHYSYFIEDLLNIILKIFCKILTII